MGGGQRGSALVPLVLLFCSPFSPCIQSGAEKYNGDITQADTQNMGHGAQSPAAATRWTLEESRGAWFFPGALPVHHQLIFCRE